jgi:hypothetical protein
VNLINFKSFLNRNDLICKFWNWIQKLLHSCLQYICSCWMVLFIKFHLNFFLILTVSHLLGVRVWNCSQIIWKTLIDSMWMMGSEWTKRKFTITHTHYCRFVPIKGNQLTWIFVINCIQDRFSYNVCLWIFYEKKLIRKESVLIHDDVFIHRQLSMTTLQESAHILIFFHIIEIC